MTKKKVIGTPLGRLYAQRPVRFATSYLHHLLCRIANPQSKSANWPKSTSLAASFISSLHGPKMETSYCMHTMNVQVFMVANHESVQIFMVCKINNYDGTQYGLKE
jgi:hypothetical protein